MSQSVIPGTTGVAPNTSPVNDYQNLGLDLTSGRLLVTQADGTELIDSSPGQVRVAVKGSLGQEQVVNVTKPYKLDDDSHASLHDLTGWHPYWESGDDWSAPRPYFLYLIVHDTATSDPAFGISQCPNYFTSPAAASMNVSGTINSNAQTSMLLFEVSDGAGGWDTPTIANYDENPCVCLGSIRAAVTDTGNDDQTFETIRDTDGFGRFQEGVEFLAPNGTVGSYAGFFAEDPGSGGAITFTSGSCTYTIEKDGFVNVSHYWENCTAASSNSSELALMLPYDIGGLAGDRPMGYFLTSVNSRLAISSDPTGGRNDLVNIAANGSTIDIRYNDIDVGETFGLYFRYPAFRNDLDS